MSLNATGMIETRGFVGAIEAADTMLKSAKIELAGIEKTGGGFVTVIIKGDAAEVKTAIDAGSAAAEKISELISVHIIPRLHPSVEFAIMGGKTETGKKFSLPVEEQPESSPLKQKKPKVEKKINKLVKSDKTNLVPEKPRKEYEAILKKPKNDTILRLRREALGIEEETFIDIKENSVRENKVEASRQNLETLNVHQLRRLARSTEGFPIQGRQISMANRRELLNYFNTLS